MTNLHHLVDQLPEEKIAPVLRLVRETTALDRRSAALATLERVRDRMRGVTGADEEPDQLRDQARG